MSKRQHDLKEKNDPDQFLKSDLKFLDCRGREKLPVWVNVTGLVSDSIYVGKTDMVLHVETEEDFNKLEYCFNQGLLLNVIIRNLKNKKQQKNFTFSENFLSDWR